MKRNVALVLAVSTLVFGLAVVPASPISAQAQAQQSVAQRCFEHHKFGAQPVDVAKTADGETVLAQTSWNWHDAIGCYLTLDPQSLAVLQAAPPPQILPNGPTSTSKQCFEHHQFGESPVDVAKTADRQTVLARLSWGYHASIGCYLTLDSTALATLRAAYEESARPVVVPAPEDRAVVAEQQVGAGGAVVSGGNVSVSVPAGAISGQAEVEIREPLGEFGDEVGGEPVGVEHSGPVRAPVTVEWDVSHLSETQQQVLVLVRWDEELEDWVADEAGYRVDNGMLAAEIQQWSAWSWVTDKVSKVKERVVKGAKKVVEVAGVVAEKVVEGAKKAVEEVVEFGDSLGQTLLEIAGARVDAPKCQEGALHSWVDQATESDEGTTSAAIRMCYENGPGESVRVKMANNRTFSQLIEIKGGDGYRRPHLSGVESTLAGLTESIIHSNLTNDQRVFVPSLATVQVDVPRPAAPGTHTVRFTNLAEIEAIVADAVIYLVDFLDLLSVLDDDSLAAAIDVLIECAQDQLHGTAQTASSPSLSQIAGHVAECALDIYKPGTYANRLYQQKLQERAKEAAVSTLIDKALDYIKRKSRFIRKAVKYLILAEIAVYGLDLFLEGIKGLTTWKITGQGQLPEPQTTPTAQTTTANKISAGWAHTCAIATDQTITCWGDNRVGQADPPSGRFTAISTGGGHSCGLRADNSVACWGYNESGQTDPPSGQFTAIAAGQDHSCAIRVDQTVACWGRSVHFDEGQADPPWGRFTAISAGGYHSCAIRVDQTIACWGANWFEQADPPSGRFAVIAAGQEHSCGIRTDGTATCWRFGEAADLPSDQFTAITPGLGGHSCGIRTDGTATCWGNNYYGQSDAPEGQFFAIAVGREHSCGLLADGTARCWGNNGAGQTDAPQGRFSTAGSGGRSG